MTTVSMSSNDRTDMRDAFQAALAEILGREVEISEPVLLAGGASKEAWSVDADGERLLVRRAAATVMHHHTLTLAQEYAAIEAAYDAGVKVPKPYGYVADLAGREAFAMERLEGDTIGRRIVRKDELAAATSAVARAARGGAREDPRDSAGAAAVPAGGRHRADGRRSSTRSASRIRRSSSGCGGCARTARRSVHAS